MNDKNPFNGLNITITDNITIIIPKPIWNARIPPGVLKVDITYIPSFNQIYNNL